jgi:hypothetical protein
MNNNTEFWDYLDEPSIPNTYTVKVTVSSQNKDAIKALVRSYFAKELLDDEFSSKGDVTIDVVLDDYEIEAELGRAS